MTTLSGSIRAMDTPAAGPETLPRELALLREMPVFGGLADGVLARLVREAERTQCAPGELFFREGDEGHNMYVLLAGSVEITRGRGCERRTLGRLGPGDCFGEMALIDLYPRSASVRALAPCEALRIGHQQLYALYQDDPEPFTLIMMNLAREISRRLRELETRLFLEGPDPAEGAPHPREAPEHEGPVPYV